MKIDSLQDLDITSCFENISPCSSDDEENQARIEHRDLESIEERGTGDTQCLERNSDQSPRVGCQHGHSVHGLGNVVERGLHLHLHSTRTAGVDVEAALAQSHKLQSSKAGTIRLP